MVKTTDPALLAKLEETKRVSKGAFEASGCQTHLEFLALFGEKVIGLRTFRAWIAGEAPASPISLLVLREFIAGWRPTI